MSKAKKKIEPPNPTIEEQKELPSSPEVSVKIKPSNFKKKIYKKPPTKVQRSHTPMVLRGRKKKRGNY